MTGQLVYLCRGDKALRHPALWLRDPPDPDAGEEMVPLCDCEGLNAGSCHRQPPAEKLGPICASGRAKLAVVDSEAAHGAGEETGVATAWIVGCAGATGWLESEVICFQASLRGAFGMVDRGDRRPVMIVDGELWERTRRELDALRALTSIC